MNKNILLTIVWGVVSMALYVIVFLNQQAVTDYFTRGGVFSLAVIVTALVFSFVHGAFANYFIEAVGFKPVNKKGGH
ncbi:hypothetical protein SAMN05660649_00483 [Desulfotomaculum arcticum]|uniref:Uncharacterized protein n=1 Tax=Desulfotruncus arcticus DSM 17038 TaxID=1121424 RepID=A0A1I2NDL4_9FIRM|nr:hypothetical protein [Desulfotruncus arcticus]SFG01638.1 hypothetical protein SAMN05660649_00483 [Desulfotomaculum arcticum] [Desulfotruncus arcticus DSM 17038]